MSHRTLILSDTHFGRPKHAARSAEALRPLWQGYESLIINGDVGEVHHPRYQPVAARQTMKLLELCERDGVEVTLLSGNHDPYITDVRHLELCGGAVFVTHGDVLHPAVAPWSPRAGRMKEAHERALAALPPQDRNKLAARLAVSQYAATAEWDQMAAEASKSAIWRMLVRPWAVAHVLWYWWRVPGLAARFLEQHAPAAKFAIIGHTHLPGVWTVRERVIINTGAFGFPGTPRGVEIDEEARALTVLAIDREQERYRFAREPVAKFPVEASANAPQPTTVAA